LAAEEAGHDLAVRFAFSYAEHRRAMVALAGGPAAGRADVADALPVFFVLSGVAVALGALAWAAGEGAMAGAMLTPLSFGAGFAWVIRQRREVAYRFGAGGFVRAFGARERHVAWAEVGAAEDGEFFLFRAGGEGWYLPRRAVGEAGRARLRALMAEARPAPSADDERERDDSR
jgi:hypothetical protein